MQLSDKDFLSVSLTTHKHMAEQYLATAEHSASPGFLSMLMDLCNQEQQARLQVYQAMNQRGWYNPKSMDQQQMQQAYQSFSQTRSQLAQQFNSSSFPYGHTSYQTGTQTQQTW